MEENNINPLTGLQYGKKAALNEESFSFLSSPAEQTNLTNEPLESFTKYGVTPVKNSDIEESRAELQPTSEKLANGIIKFGGKTLTATAGGILGPVIGIPTAIKDGSFNSFFDNDYQRWLDSMNESMDTNLPNYKTKEEQDAGFFKSLGTANFWADDFLGAMSFTTGAILTEYATAGLGSLGIANKIMSPLQKAARAKEVLKGLDLVSNLNAFGKAANVTRQLITGAGYEAGVEARQFKDEARKSAIAGFMQTHDGQEPNEQELADIESHVNNTANAVFAANMGIVGLSNFLQYPKIFGLGTKAEIGLFGKVGLMGEQGAYKGAYTETKGLTKGLYKTAKILERPVEEGLWEEGMQSTVQNAAQNYITNMYSIDGLNNQKDIFDSLGDAFAESYGTKEGWKSIGMGMLIGGIGSPSFRYNKAEGLGSLWAGGVPDALKELSDTQKNIDNLATKNNNFNVAQITEQAKQNRAIYEASKRYDAAVERGDMFEAKSAEHDVLFAMTAARHEAGLAGNFKTDLVRHIDSLTDEQFADTYGYTNKTAEELQARKSEVKEKAIKKIDQHIKAIEKAKQLLPSEDSQDEGRKNMQLGLAYAISGVEDLDTREEEIAKSVQENIKDFYSFNKGAIKDLMNYKANNIIANLTDADQLTKELEKIDNLRVMLNNFNDTEASKEQIKDINSKIKESETKLKELEKDFTKELPKNTKYKRDFDQFKSKALEYKEMEKQLKEVLNENPFQKHDIEQSLGDLEKIAKRREDLINTYNKLFTKAGQKEVDTMTKQMLKQLQAFGIHIANPEANLRAMAQMELQRTGKTINEFGKVVPIEDNIESTDEAIKDALNKLSTKVDDTSKNIFKDVQDLLEESPITLAELNTFVQKITVFEKALQQDKNKYSDEDTQLMYEDILMNIMDRLTEAKAQLATLKAGVKEAANTPFAATINNPSDVFTLFQGFISPEVQSMVSALSNEDLKGRVRIKIEDLPEEMKNKPLLEKIKGSGVFLKNGHTKKENKGIYVYLDDVRIGGLFDPRRFVHKNGKEMIISENNPALIKLINPDFVAPDNTLTDTGKKFVRYYKAMKNFYETTLDIKDELSPEETEKLLNFQVIAERFIKYADENVAYSERPKIATEFSDSKWNVEIPGVFKGLIVFNRLKLDDEYRTGEYIFIKSEGKTSWEKPDDNLKSQIQDFINKQSKENNLTIGWGSMSQYGLLVKTNESGKNLRVVDVGIPTLTIEDKKGFMNNLFTQVKEAAEQFNDPNFDKTVVNKTLLDERGNEYFVPLLTGKEKKEGALKTQLRFSVFKNGDVTIGLEIYYKGKNYYVNVKKVFKESLTVDSIEKVLTFDKLIGRLDSYLSYNLTQESSVNKEGIAVKSSLYGTPIAKFEPSLSLNDPIRRMPDLEGNEDLFEQMVVNSNVVFGSHNIQVKPKDAETSKYDVNNPLPKTQTKATTTTTPKGITSEQKEALDKALEPNATVIDMIGIYGDLKPKIASLDKDTIEKLNTINNRIQEFRKKIGIVNAEEDEVKEEVKSDLADIQQEYKTLKDELDELDAKISLNVNDKADEVRRVEVKAKVAELANKIKEEKAKKVDDEDSVVFSTSVTPTSDRMEYEKALKTLKRILPDFISTAEISTLIKNIQNKGETWGAFMDKIVYLNKSKAGVGTEYHEAFHAVFRLLLTNSEIDSYYDAASKRYGTPSKAQLDSLKNESSAYKSLSYKSLRKLFYEEKMADDFKKYALNKDKESKTGFTGWLKNLFDKLLRMFNAISDNREELDILFSNIYSGSFKNAKEKYNIFSKFKKPAFSLLKTNDPLLEGSDPISTLSRFKSEKLIHTIAAKLFSNVIESKGYYTEKDLNDVIDNIKSRYSPDNYTEELKRLYANTDIKSVTKARKAILEFKNALEREDNVKIIKDDVQTIIKELYGVSLDEDFEESKNEQDTGRNEFEERSMSSVGGMNSLSKKMKQYMNMTMYYTDEFGLGITPEELNQEKYQVAINGSELYQGLERLLANTNKTQLFEKLYQYKSSNVNADAFYNKIVQDIADDIDSNFESVENMLRDLGNIENDQVQLEAAYKQLSSSPAFNSFITAFNKNKVKYFKVLYDAKKGNIKGINANDQDVDTIQFEKWKNNFISKQLNKGQVDEILSNIRSMMNNYNFNTKKEDLNSAINSIKSEFGKLGIDLSFGFIKYSLVTKHADTVNKIAMTGNQYAQELIKFIDIFSDVIPLQTYESLIEGEDKDMFKVLKELNAKSDLRGKDATGEAATAGFFAKNVVDGEEAADTGAETRLKQLAENNAIFDESVGESTFQNAENKTVFDKVFPSYITQAITSLKENVLTQSDLNDVLSLKEAYRVRGTILSDYQAAVLLQVLQNNPLLKGLNYNSKSGFSEDSEVTDFIFNNMQVFIMDGLKQESLDEDSFGGTQEQGKTYKDLDKRAKALMMLSMFADTTQKFSNKVLEGFNPEGTRLFILGTNEAKSTTVGVNLPVQNFYANGSLTELGLAYFNSTFKQEYERIQKIVKELKVLQDKLNIIEAKKADIERRRQEELELERNSLNLLNEGWIGKELTSEEQDELFQAIYYNEEIPTIGKKIIADELLDNFNTINAKYDKELATLGIIEPLINYSHSYHGEIPFIRSIQFNDEGNITNWDSLEKVPRGLKFFQFAKMQGIALLNKQAVEGASLPEVNGELQNFAKSQLSDYLEMLSKSDVDILKKTDTGYNVKQLPSYYKKESSEEVDENKIGQYFFNHYFNTTAFNFMLHGDYAMNYKDSVDVVKRNGGLIAFGPDMGLGTSNYAMVEDEEIEIDEINSDDKSVNRTDAQALGHINWYIDTYLKGMGKYNKAVAPILDRIKMGLDLLEPLTKTELAILENNNATLQPRKIVQRDMFTYLKTSLHTITRAQVSYINPSFREGKSVNTIKKLIEKYSNEKNFDKLDEIFKPIPGKEKLHALYNQMERQDIGFTIFNSGSKMSNFDVGRYNGTSWELNKKFINNNTIREQVSTDGFKEKIVHGTQLMNLIWSEQDMKAVASFMDKSVRVSHLVDAYKELLKYRVKIGSIDLKNTIFESSPDGKLTEAKWGELQQSFFESLEKSGADPYLLELFVEREDGTGAPKYNPNFAFVQAKYEAMYLAYVSKATLAQKTAGRKYTLVSDFGNNVMRDGNDNVIRIDQFRANPSEYSNITTSRLKHRVADGKGGFYSEVIISEKAARVHNLKAGDTIPDVLAEQFGIRIPTQDDHSMANLKVVDVIPGYYGNAITVPVEIIKLSGADFDIDSMYARIFSVFNNQFKNNGLHAHGDYLKADNIESAYEIAFDEYLNAVAKESAVKEQLEELRDYDENYYNIKNEIDEILEEINKSKIEDSIFTQAVKDKIDGIKAVYSTDEEFNDQLIRKTYKGELNQHVFNLKIQTAKLVGKISKGVYAEDKKELLEHLDRLKQLSRETNKRLQLEAIKLAGYASTKNDFLDAQSLNKDGILKNNRDLINKNLKAFNNGDIEDITPLSKEEADNLLLSIERGLLHNSSEAKKKIGLTPSSMDNFKSLRKTFTKMGLPSADATTGINSPLDILLSANANDVGKKGIGPAALFNVIFQKLNESNVHLSEKFKEGLLGGLDKFNTFSKFNNAEGKRINDVVSSIISAMTDNAKERYAAAFNLTPDTLGPALTMVGLGIPFDTVMAFMKQPIIVEMANWYTMSQSPVKPQFTKGETDEEKADVKSKFSALVNKKGEAMLNEAINSLGLKGVEVKQEFDLVNFAPDSDLVQGLLKGNNAESRLSKEQYEQLQVLVGNMFLEYKKMSDNLMNLSAVSALTKGLKSTWVETKSLDDSLEKLGFKIATNSLDGPNSYTLGELPIKDEDKIFLGLKDVLSKPDVLTNLQTYGFVRDSAKFYFILQTPQAKRIAEQIKKNFREGHFAYEENKIALDRAIISGLTMLAYKNKISVKTKKDFKFNFNLLFSETPGTWGKLPLLMQKALKTERYRNNPLLNYLKTKQITFEKNVFKGRTLNKIEGNTRSEKNYDYLEALMDGYRQIAVDSFNNIDLNDGLTSKEIQALNGWLVQYIIAKDSLLFLKGSYIKNLTPAALRNASVSLDDIQELFSETSNKSFVDVFGMPKQDVLAEIEELYSRGVETAWRGLKGSKAKLDVLRAESAKVAKDTKDYPFFIDKDSLTLNIYASLTNSTSESEKKDIISKNLSMLKRNELAQETEVGGKTKLAFPTFLMIKNDKVNDYWKVKSFNATIGGKSVKIDSKGYILEGSNKGKNLEDVSSSSYNSIFTPEGIVATKIEYEKTLGKLGHKSVKPWAFTVAQWDALLSESLDRQLLEEFSSEEIEMPEEVDEATSSFEQLMNKVKKEVASQKTKEEQDLENLMNKVREELKNNTSKQSTSDEEGDTLSLFSDEQSTSKEQAETILNKLSEKFGVKWKWDNTIKGLGQFSNNVVLINPDKFKSDTLFHEFAHPFVLAISRINPTLYQSLKQEILTEGKTLERVRKEYKNEITNEEDFIMESIVTLMGKYASEVNNKKSENLTSSIKDLINKFFKEFAKLLKLITGNKDINVRELTNMSIRDLSALMVLGDNKIILPNVLTTYSAIQRILRTYNLKNGNISPDDYNKVKKAVDIYNMGVGNTSIYISKGPSGYAILSNHINFEELEKRGIIKINCK